MSENEILEAVTAVGEVSPAGEATASVDLSVVSQQLDLVVLWQKGQLAFQAVFFGCLLGAFLAILIGRWWR